MPGHTSIVAYTTPFLIYVLLTAFESTGWLGLKYETVCILKGCLAAIAVWVYRKHYPAFSKAGLWLSVAAGILGCVVWVALERLQSQLPGMDFLQILLMQGNRVGFNPFADSTSATANLPFVIVRLLELTIIVPIAEELFWRGFLSRYLIDEDFERVRQGTFTAFSFVIVTIAFAMVHPEVLAAIAWGMMINGLYRKTSNLWACVVMHAVTNGLLGIYILTTQSWYLW